jgi:hypothetical protein
MLTMIQLDVSDDDIRAMEDRYNSGMCDRTTANAISLALRKRLLAQYKPKVEFASNHNSCELRIGEETYSLPQNLYWWLRDSENGREVKSSKFSFAISASVLRKDEQAPEQYRGALPDTALVAG